MAVTTAHRASTKTKTAASSIGAPAQHNQSSRKGKKAWRKNVDIEGVEGKLEEIRGEERLFGTALHARKNEDLFIVDKRGDDKVRKSLPKFSKTLLTSHKILSQRSAIPAVFSRPTSTSSRPRKHSHVSYTEKERLLKMGKKNRRGPLNSVVDHDQVGEGSALLEVSEAVQKSGKYDVWSAQDLDVDQLKVKAPNTPHPRQLIDVPAVQAPHLGTSYNPPVEAHSELLRSAHSIEERRAKEQETSEEFKNRIMSARREVGTEEGGVVGMLVDKPGEVDGEDATDVDDEGESVVKKVPQRKTKQQRRKAEKQRAEKRALAERALRRKLLASVDSVKTIRKEVDKNKSAHAHLEAARRARLQDRLRKGLAGQRLGKHTVKEDNVDVQLGEDLSESLRGLKPEGNLFRDRFMSMQHRALIEPRVPVLPKKRKAKTKEVEKHAWKRFE